MTIRTARIVVDIFMTIFLVLSFVRWDAAAFAFHAVVGIVFSLLVVLHLFLNRKWLVSVWGSVKAGKVNEKVKRLFIVDMCLIIVWGIAIVTGFLAIPSFVFGNESFYVFGRLHGVSSRLGAVIVIIHIFQHLGQIRSYLGLKKR